MLSKIINFVKKFQQEIILFLGVLLVSALSFAFGYIIAKNQEKDSLQFEDPVIYEDNENSKSYRNNS